MCKNILTPERIAYWFFRLNGCLTIVNFVVHPDNRGSQRTDADILAVRFPYREELDMKDHDLFIGDSSKIFIGIVEVKQGLCNLNGPWTNQNNGNINRVLKSIGAFKEDEIENVASQLYKKTFYSKDNFIVRLIAVGKTTNEDLTIRYPELKQLTYKNDLLPFIYDRLRKYRNQKADHSQWDEAGKELFNKVKDSKSKEKFIREISSFLSPT